MKGKLGIPVIRGERFLGVQMALGLPEAPKKRRRKERPEVTRPKAAFAHLLCPRCGRYLVAAPAGASALCPRCGVWARNQGGAQG